MKNKKPAVIRLVLTLALLAALALFSGEALGRAGGGDGFQPPSPPPSGGGDWDGGGDWGDGWGDGEGLLYLLYFVIISEFLPWQAKIFLLATIVVFGGVMSWRKKKRRSAQADASPPRSGAPAASYAPPPPAPDPGPGLAALKAHDPGFSEQGFEDMASTAFFRIQEGWAKKDLSIARPFVSPSLLQRFQTQINEMNGQGVTNRVERLVIGSLDIVEAANDGGHDYVTVKVAAAAADYYVDKEGRVVAGSTDPKPFTEFWTFLRSDKVKTQKGEEIASRHCPNCGAPISLNAVGKCDYCDSDITSGEFSWVLAEITQPSVWRPRAQARRPEEVSPLAGGRYVLGLVQCPNCGAQVQDIHGITNERCWRCGGEVPTEK